MSIARHEVKPGRVYSGRSGPDRIVIGFTEPPLRRGERVIDPESGRRGTTTLRFAEVVYAEAGATDLQRRCSKRAFARWAVSWRSSASRPTP